MRKIILGIIITGFALALFITLKPQAADLVILPETPGTDMSREPVILEPAPYFPVVQGDSELALTVKNNSKNPISFSLGHEHAFLTFQPQGDRLAPGATREIFVYVDPLCPVGEINLPVYLRAEVDGERIGMDTSVLMNVIQGKLALELSDNRLVVLWNGEQAPRGVFVYYRLPGARDWQLWGETPRIDPPAQLSPGTYRFEFKAELGDVVSAVETFEITVEKPVVKKQEEPESEPVVVASAAEETEPEPKPLTPEEQFFQDAEDAFNKYQLELMKESFIASGGTEKQWEDFLKKKGKEFDDKPDEDEGKRRPDWLSN